MTDIKFPEGSIIVKGGGRHKILGACGEVRFVSYAEGQGDDALRCIEMTNTVYRLERQNYVEVAKPWVPEAGKTYWLVNSKGIVNFTLWTNSKIDQNRRDFGNCFPTKEAAEARRDAIKALGK